MEIILLEDVGGVGTRGHKVKVSPGYARNYLIPNRLAIPASGAGANIYKEAERQRAARDNRHQSEARGLALAIEKLNITIPMEAGEEDRLFGSVTAQDIATQIAAQGFEIDKRKVLLDEPLKQLGVFTVPIKLHGNVEAQAKVWVVKK
jgi:large subunit ribosomal protein L9